MMERHVFTVKGYWEGDRLGQGEIQANGFKTTVSVPKQLEGPGVGSNPEELLISSAANCYLITLASILSNRGITYSKIDLSSEGVVSKKEKKLTFEQIIHKPVIYGSTGLSNEDLNKYVNMAEKACFISRTLNDNVKITVEPKLGN